MTATEHVLKTQPPFFDDVRSGNKTFELRRDDRRYSVGDILLLREFDPRSRTYTGRHCRRRVTYVLRDAEAFGLAPGFVILGLLEVM